MERIGRYLILDRSQATFLSPRIEVAHVVRTDELRSTLARVSTVLIEGDQLRENLSLAGLRDLIAQGPEEITERDILILFELVLDADVPEAKGYASAGNLNQDAIDRLREVDPAVEPAVSVTRTGVPSIVVRSCVWKFEAGVDDASKMQIANIQMSLTRSELIVTIEEIPIDDAYTLIGGAWAFH